MSHVKRDSARDEEYEVVPVAALRAVESMNLAREKASGREGFYSKRDGFKNVPRLRCEQTRRGDDDSSRRW